MARHRPPAAIAAAGRPPPPTEEEPCTPPPPYEKAGRRRLLVSVGAALAAVALAIGMGATAYADTLFTDNFEDGNSAGWSRSGGSWSVATDGSRVYRQSSTSSDARARAGTASWTNYTVTARVKPTAFNGSNRFVARAGPRPEQHQLLLPGAAQQQHGRAEEAGRRLVHHAGHGAADGHHRHLVHAAA